MPSSTLRVAAIQLNSQDHVQENLRVCAELIDQAAELGAELVVLPENFAYFGPSHARTQLAEEISAEGPILAALRNIARSARVTIIAGGFPERSTDPARPYNTALVMGPRGALLAQYRKIHLFDTDLGDGQAYCESATTSSGAEPVVVSVQGWQVGLSICYDLRFPELYRALSAQGAQVFVVPSAFTKTTGTDHWHPLLRARAIEGQCWVVAAAQWGEHPGLRHTYGHSLIADPWGKVVSECPDGVGVIYADLDPALVDDVRTRLPSLQHRRL